MEERIKEINRKIAILEAELRRIELLEEQIFQLKVLKASLPLYFLPTLLPYITHPFAYFNPYNL